MKLVTVDEMRAVEREADQSGWSYASMMDAAGNGLADVVHAYFGYADDLFALALVGSGNNGGDALVALASLAGMGWRTAAYIVREREQDDDLVEKLQNAGGFVATMALDEDLSELEAWMEGATVLIDGVLGTGVRLPLRPDIARLLAFVRDADVCPAVVAVDCPSGVDCDNGLAAPECIPADVTVCMAAVKAGLLKFPAFQLVGELQVVSIGIPSGVAAWERIHREVIDEGFVRSVLPRRADDGHKGTFGTAIIAAGSVLYPGAVLLAGKAALRVGTGLVTLATPAPVQGLLAGHIPEATWLPLAHQEGFLSVDAVSTLTRGLEKADAFLFGPGFGLEDSTVEFVRKLAGGGFAAPARPALGFVGSIKTARGEENPSSQRPLPQMVVDADGLKILARMPGWARMLPQIAVLTPHPGEMAILTGLDKEEIQADRLEVASKFARQWGHVVVLKGAFSVIAAPDGRVGVIPVASSALAHAGTGDALAGIITGLRAQGLGAFEAAAAGAWIHARAGLAAEQRLGHAACVSASELIDSLKEILVFIWPQE